MQGTSPRSPRLARREAGDQELHDLLSERTVNSAGTARRSAVKRGPIPKRWPQRTTRARRARRACRSSYRNAAGKGAYGRAVPRSPRRSPALRPLRGDPDARAASIGASRPCARFDGPSTWRAWREIHAEFDTPERARSSATRWCAKAAEIERLMN